MGFVPVKIQDALPRFEPCVDPTLLLDSVPDHYEIALIEMIERRNQEFGEMGQVTLDIGPVSSNQPGRFHTGIVYPKPVPSSDQTVRQGYEGTLAQIVSVGFERETCESDQFR